MNSESNEKNTRKDGENDDDEMLLYGDLCDGSIPDSYASTVKPAAQSLTGDGSHPKSFTEQVAELQTQVECLNNENQKLRRNIGTLFRTARSEIKRKDAEISRLMEELDKARSP